MSHQPPQQYGGQGFEQAGYGQGGRQQAGPAQWGAGETPPTGQQGFGQHAGAGQTGQYGEQRGQQRGGQQPGEQWTQRGQQVQGAAADVKLEEAISDEMRVALHDFVQAATACEWCAERCIDEGPEMAECLRLCRDVADLATLNVQLIARDSVFGPEAAAVFADAAEACAQECARHSQRHCQECAEVLTRAVRSTRKMLASFGGPGGMEPQGQSGAMGRQGQPAQPGAAGYGGQPAQPGGMEPQQGSQQFQSGQGF